ncbi:hypothetical protein BDR07DRAFT_372163 [Suillus spraguei]|nr:hypothetical protein BDR07DRAFT_372163 [Suillus spraguei]
MRLPTLPACAVASFVLAPAWLSAPASAASSQQEDGRSVAEVNEEYTLLQSSISCVVSRAEFLPITRCRLSILSAPYHVAAAWISSISDASCSGPSTFCSSIMLHCLQLACHPVI